MISPIEAYLAELRRRLRGSWFQRRRTVSEVGQHLAETAAGFEQGGVGRDEAERMAIKRFGDVETTAALLSTPRRWRVGVATAGVTCVAVLGLVWITSGSGPASTPAAFAAATPWSPTIGKIDATYWVGVGQPDAPPCRSADLRPGRASMQGATQQMLGGLTIVNRSKHTCTLTGVPTLTLITTTGQPIHAPEHRDSSLVLHGVPRWPGAPMLALLPHHPASVYFNWATYCAAAAPARVRLRSRSATVLVPMTDSPMPTCHPKDSYGPGWLRVGGFQPQQAPDWMSQGQKLPLRFAISDVRNTRVSSWMTYVVTLTNPGPKPFRFKRCPTYWQGLSTQAHTMMNRSHALVLNCRTTPTIPAHAHRSYRMRIKILPSTQPGKTQLDWIVLPTQSGPAQATKHITIARAN